MQGRITSLRIKALKALSEFFSASSFFIQGRMDIDERSLWYDADFNQQHGGFFTSNQNGADLNSLPMHDLVRRDMLLLLCRSVEERKVPGSIAELGVFKGHTAKLFHHYMPQRRLFLLDTFQGFPEKAVKQEATETGFKTGTKHFANTSVSEVLEVVQPQNENIELVEGYFPDSATEELKTEKFALVHLDADLYQPTLAGLEFFYPRLNVGAILVVHDYNAWLGARKAVEEFCEKHNLIPIPMPDKSGSCILIKQ